MKILVIGGTGHVGSFLVPMLVKEGHDVFVATRGNKPLRAAGALKGASFITLDATSIESLEALKGCGFDTVVDFPGTAHNVWQALKNDIAHLVATGSLWMFGYPNVVPTPEIMQNEVRFEGYRKRSKEIHEMAKESGKCKAVFTAIMPPNICGPGKIPIDQLGGRSADAHKALANGEKVYLPDGPEALIGPCDAEDIATLFDLAINNRDKAAGEIFNVGAEYSLTYTELIRVFGKIHDKEIPIEYISWQKFTEEVATNIGAWWHFYAHMRPDITKAKTLLGYKPKYTPEETIARAVKWMKDENII